MSGEDRYKPELMDWQPLEQVVGADAMGDWMWMNARESPATGRMVHFYKHSWSRRYLRLDVDGRVYREDHTGAIHPLPGCGGATLLLRLIIACAHVPPAMPARIALPPAAREETTVDDLEDLAVEAYLTADEFARMLDQSAPDHDSADMFR